MVLGSRITIHGMAIMCLGINQPWQKLKHSNIGIGIIWYNGQTNRMDQETISQMLYYEGTYAIHALHARRIIMLLYG